jgi:NAD(P)-dependent dehydrogenase (short-subunit alcohol dehydrogenase family)
MTADARPRAADGHFGYNFTIAVQLQPCQGSIMIVFITGASAGFGAAMARTFVKNGHQVVLAARRKDRLDDAGPRAGRIRAAGRDGRHRQGLDRGSAVDAAAVLAPDRRPDQQRRPGAEHQAGARGRRWTTGTP